MRFVFVKTPFFFLRHAQTDHNVYNVYTVRSSPLLRVQQTKEIVLKNKKCRGVIVDDLRECSSAFWRLFIASKSCSLTKEIEK
jgi:broad specificity phosphatase PhoE